MGSPVAIIGKVSNRNYIINGGIDFAQRIGQGGSVTLSGPATYYIDRWQTAYNGSWSTNPVLNQVVASPVIPDQLVSNVMGVIGHPTATNASFSHYQKIESVHAQELLNQNVSVGFWIFSSNSTSQANIQLSYPTAQDDYTGVTTFYSSPNSIVIPSFTWTYLQFNNLSIPSGVLNGLLLQINVTNWSNLNAGTGAYISEVMLNIGPVANRFVRSAGNIQAELDLCQRYCHVMSGSSNERYGLGQTVDSSHALIDYFFPTPMRITPTPTYTAAGTFLTHGNNGSNYVLNAIGNANVGSPFSFVHSVATGTTWAVNVPMELTGNASVTARIIYDAEIT